MLKAAYEEQFELAAAEDREKHLIELFREWVGLIMSNRFASARRAIAMCDVVGLNIN